MPLLNLLQFCRELPARRNKAALLLTSDIREQRAYAAQIATAANARHFDVLDAFQADGALTSRLAGFSSDDFFRLLTEQKAPLLIVSGLEFLLAAWLSQGNPKDVKRQFCQQIELWDGRDNPAFLLVTQQDAVFASYEPTRYTGSRIVIPLSETQALS